MKNDRCCYSSPKDIVFAVLVLTSSKHRPSFKLLKSSLEYSTYPTLQTCVLVSHLEKEVNLAKLKSQERLRKGFHRLHIQSQEEREKCKVLSSSALEFWIMMDLRRKHERKIIFLIVERSLGLRFFQWGQRLLISFSRKGMKGSLWNLT